MQYHVKKGENTEYFDIDERQVIEVMAARPIEAAAPGPDIVRESLAHPIGSQPLSELAVGAQHVCLLTSDITRPLPTAQVLPPVMEQLHAAGITDDRVTLAIALGSHRPQTEAELERIMASYYGKLRVINGDAGGYADFGTTGAGTPVRILREVADCDLRVALGNVEYHYFAGYSGGAKALVPGVASVETIQANHSLMVDPAAHAGNMASPVRADLEEAARIVGLDFIVNVVLDEDKRIVACASGDMIAAHRAACAQLDELYGCPLEEYADIVIVSQGGAPKDLNLYQTQKALDNAKHPLREGGIVILVGSCAEGLGNAVFEEWMVQAKTPADIIERLHRGFQLGGHKAASIAQIALKGSIYLVSDLPDDVVESIFMRPFATVAEAYEAAVAALEAARGSRTGAAGSDSVGAAGASGAGTKPAAPRVLIMPHGGSTLPLMTAGR